MSMEPPVSQQIKSSNKFLLAVKTYLDLISRDDPLVYGSGLKRLYAMHSGAPTLNTGDIEAIAEKSERLHLAPQNLHAFMQGCILKNIELYAKELQAIIQKRIVAISNGDIVNPTPMFKFSAEEARRYFYTPPNPWVARLERALIADTGMSDYSFSPPTITTIQDVANDAEIILTRMQIEEGHIAPSETSWGALIACVEKLIALLESEARYPNPDSNYKTRARGGLKIMWFITKLLMGDLTIAPARKDVNQVDLNSQLNFSDGTLASIPFPLPETVKLFSDDDKTGISLKGRFYLSAVSGAAFYRTIDSDND